MKRITCYALALACITLAVFVGKESGWYEFWLIGGGVWTGQSEDLFRDWRVIGGGR
jgi:hypothetical protein